MGMEDRDWYKEWHRKKAGYTERAAFRLSDVDRNRHARRRAWLRFFGRIAYWGAVFAGVLLLARRLLS